MIVLPLTMSGARTGVQKIIKDRAPKAMYTHCAGNFLNFTILSSWHGIHVFELLTYPSIPCLTGLGY